MKSSPNALHAQATGTGSGLLDGAGRWRWLGLGLLLGACPAEALEYELQGVARDEPRALDIRFEVCVRDCQWRVRCWHEPGQGLYFDTALLTSNELIRVMEFSTQKWASAVIEAHPIPAGCEESATSLFWLLLASGCSFDPAGSGQIVPVYDPLASPVMDRARRQKAFWTLLREPPFLPERIVYLHSGQYRLWDSRTDRVAQFPLSPPYDRGFTNAVGRITEVSQVDGLTLPRAFVFEEFGKGKAEAGLSLRLKRRLTGRVELARGECTHEDLVPHPQFRTSVQDRRLIPSGEAGPVTYSVPTGAWPDLSGLRKIRRLQQNEGRPSGVQLALFCFLALAPLVMVLWRRRRGAR